MDQEIVRRAHDAMDRRDWLGAMQFWRTAAEMSPDAFWPKYWTSNMLIEMGHRSDGRGHLERLLAAEEVQEEYTLLTRITELALEDKDVDRAMETFNRARVMPQATPEAMIRLSSWIVRTKLESEGFPPSIFGFDQVLLEQMPT